MFMNAAVLPYIQRSHMETESTGPGNQMMDFAHRGNFLQPRLAQAIHNQLQLALKVLGRILLRLFTNSCATSLLNNLNLVTQLVNNMHNLTTVGFLSI